MPLRGSYVQPWFVENLPCCERSPWPPNVRLVNSPVARSNYVDVVRTVAVAQVRVLRVGRQRPPRRPVLGLRVLAEVAVALPHHRAVERRLRQLLVVVRVVQVLGAALGDELEPVRRAVAQRVAAARHPLGRRAVRLPPHQAVGVGLAAVVLVREVDVRRAVGHEAVAVDGVRAGGQLHFCGVVLVAEGAPAADDRRGVDGSGGGVDGGGGGGRRRAVRQRVERGEADHRERASCGRELRVAHGSRTARF